MEWDAAVGGTISSLTLRSGVYAGRISSLSSGTNQRFRTQFKAVQSNGPFYCRFYLRIATLPSVENRIFALSNSTTTGTGVAVYITLDNTGALRLYDSTGSIGSASLALSTGVWYRVETLSDTSQANGSKIARASIDGVEFAAGTTQTIANGISNFYVGGNLNSEAQTTGDWFFDDIAINDTTGTAQTSYPGAGKIIHLKPNAAGDSNTFAIQVGGTAGSANNFTRVNETTPDDATTYNGSAVLSQEDLFNVVNSGILPTDVVKLVSVGIRCADLVSADATSAFKAELMKTSAGTKSQSGTIIPNSTSWKTNAAAAPFVYPLINYLDPDGANWTSTTLDSMQIGYILTATNVQTIAVSNVWALVEYTSSTGNNLSLLGVGT